MENGRKITGQGLIFERNLDAYLFETDIEGKAAGLEHLTSVVIGALLFDKFPPFIIRRYNISFGEPQGKLPEQRKDEVLDLMRKRLNLIFGEGVADKIHLVKKPIEEIYQQETDEALRDIRRFWTGDGFLIPESDEKMLDTGVKMIGDYDDIYMLKALKRKGNVLEEELPLMVEHNRRILELLKELGWKNPEFDPSDLD